MSDLQCAATLYVLGPGAELPESEPHEGRVAAVWTGSSRSPAAADLAARWDCPARIEPALDEPTRPAHENPGHDPYEEIADLHRGEGVVVLPTHPYPGHADTDRLQVRIDGDGRDVLPWR